MTGTKSAPAVSGEVRAKFWKSAIEDGSTYRQIATQYGVQASTVWRSVRRLSDDRPWPTERKKMRASGNVAERNPHVPWGVNLHRKRLDVLSDPWLDSTAAQLETVETDRRVASLLRTGFAVSEAAWILQVSRATVWRACARMGVTDEVRVQNNAMLHSRPVDALCVDHDFLRKVMEEVPDVNGIDAIVGDMKPIDAVEHLMHVLRELLWSGDRLTRTPHPKLILSATEARLLYHLWARRNRAVQNEALMVALYAADLDNAPDVSIVKAHVANVRKKVANSQLPIDIRTERGVGYGLYADDETLLNWTR